jgi:hypothetical protein
MRMKESSTWAIADRSARRFIRTSCDGTENDQALLFRNEDAFVRQSQLLFITLSGVVRGVIWREHDVGMREQQQH